MNKPGAGKPNPKQGGKFEPPYQTPPSKKREPQQVPKKK